MTAWLALSLAQQLHPHQNYHDVRRQLERTLPEFRALFGIEDHPVFGVLDCGEGDMEAPWFATPTTLLFDPGWRALFSPAPIDLPRPEPAPPEEGDDGCRTCPADPVFRR